MAAPEEPIIEGRQRSTATTVAAVLIFFVTGIFALLAVAALVSAAVSGGLPQIEGARSARVVIFVFGSIVLGVCAWTATVGVKVLQLKNWARVAAVVTFGGFVLMSVTTLFSGQEAVPVASKFLSAVVTAMDAAVVVLLLTPSAGGDFRAE